MTATIIADPSVDVADATVDDVVELPPIVTGHGGFSLDAGDSTLIPPRPGPAALPPTPRPIGQVSAKDVFVLVGSMVSAVCTTLLLFGRLTPLSGRFGFVIVSFAVFIATYALLVSLDNNRPAVVDRVMGVLLATAAVVAGAALFSVVLFTFVKGARAFTKWNFFTQDMRTTGPLDPLEVGGIAHAILGTLIIITIALIITVPLAIACAVYLNETRGKLNEIVRSVVTAMTALPSIIAGLFIFATWVLILGFEKSGLAAALAISIMMVPIVIRSADVVLRLVPGNLREASAAMGAPQWRTVRHVVLPTARSGLATSVILGVARGIGETAPVLLVSGVTASLNRNPRENPMMSLPLATYEFVRAPQPALIARGFATAAFLMLLVLLLFAVARILGGRPAGNLSNRQAKRAAARSARDVERFDARSAATSSTPDLPAAAVT